MDEDHRRRPAVVFVSVGDIGARILIDLHREVTFGHQAAHRGISIGLLIHDVAPVAPPGFKIEQHKLVLAHSLGKDRVRPWMPGDGVALRELPPARR
jgi:hypothetical protein